MLAGAIGALLILLIASYFSFNIDNEVKNPVTDVGKSEEVDTKHNVSTIGNTSNLVDMVEDASKAIVEVVNHSEQFNRFGQDSENGQKGTGSGVVFKKGR